MFKPLLYETEKDCDLISSFGGYDCNTVINENLFNDELNMSADNYPAFSPRGKRAFFNVEAESLSQLHSKAKLCYIKDGYLYYGGEKITTYFFGECESQRQFVSMGARLIVFPDKVYINTADFNDYGFLEANYKGSGIVCSMCKADGTEYEYTVSATEPDSPENGELWMDISSDEHCLKQYSGSTEMWVDVASTYVRICGTGIGLQFNCEDGVLLEGFGDTGLDGAHLIRQKGDDYIIISGLIEKSVTLDGDVNVSRSIPDMDFICESSNRLWGCSSVNNEIYASKLGDPSNFNCFSGISTDSYAVSLGSDGEFTGAVAYRGYILFFKENCVHKIYGTNPPYVVSTSYMRGVQKGSHGSLVCLNETLYYKAPTGICAYEGGVPICISSPLGDRYYTDAVAGKYMSKYYICMTDTSGDRVLFSFDTEKRIWHKEDNINIVSFAENNCNLYFAEKRDNDFRLGIINGERVFGNLAFELSGITLEEDFQWYAQTGLWGLSLPEGKYYGNFTFRATGEKGTRISVYYDTDSEDDFKVYTEERLDKTGSFNVPVSIPRCDHLQLKICGKGKARIYSLMRKIESGSDLNV